MCRFFEVEQSGDIHVLTYQGRLTNRAQLMRFEFEQTMSEEPLNKVVFNFSELNQETAEKDVRQQVRDIHDFAVVIAAFGVQFTLVVHGYLVAPLRSLLPAIGIWSTLEVAIERLEEVEEMAEEQHVG